ncbi:MAG: SDR family oxidoreductase [Patescibacteria group bacterium]
MIKRVLVVGGAGYIGGSVTDSLNSHKIPFTVYDNLTYESHYLKPVDFQYGDVRDTKKLISLLPGFTHVIWLAAIVGDGACAIQPSITKQVNQDSVAWLAHHFAGRILFTSTCSVYGASITPVTEASPTNPLSLYAQTKLEAEKYLVANNALIFRLGTAFGLSDTYSRIRMDLAINYMTMNAVKNKQLTIFGGKQWRPFIHVKDIGEIITKNLDTSATGIYNLATANSTILDIGEQIREVTGCNISITDQKFQDNRNYNAVITKGLHDGIFSTKTKYTISHGIKEVYDLISSHRIRNPELELYSNEKYLLQFMAQYETSFTK